MIISRISGGIGNQLFQYALGRALSLKEDSELKLDTHFYTLGIEKDRAFRLSNFNISGQLATHEDFERIGVPFPIANNLFTKLSKKTWEVRERLKPLTKRKLVEEPLFPFNPKILETQGSRYLSGVWQSEKYFKSAEDIIRKDITLRDEPSAFFKEWAEKMKNTESVSLHVRRGDYVSNPNTLNKHGTCDAFYYENAVKVIVKKIQSPTFFVFSDDIEWAKENIKTGFSTHFVSAGSSALDCEELILMSHCKHHVIANSSFSWWGAWLNPSKNKTVVAPKRWFNVENIDTKDLLPKEWLSI